MYFPPIPAPPHHPPPTPKPSHRINITDDDTVASFFTVRYIYECASLLSKILAIPQKRKSILKPMTKMVAASLGLLSGQNVFYIVRRF